MKSPGEKAPDGDKRIAVVFDLDGTITRKDTYRAYLAGFMRRRPHLFLRMPELLFFWLLFTLRLRSNSWLKTQFLRVIMGGAKCSEIEPWTEQFVTQAIRLGLRPRALEILRYHQQAGHTAILATASFDFYVERMGQMLGFEHIICTRASWSPDRRLGGGIEGMNCYGSEKVKRLQAHFGERRTEWQIRAYTDHHSDLPLILWADDPVAVNPTKRMAELARESKVPIADWG